MNIIDSLYLVLLEYFRVGCYGWLKNMCEFVINGLLFIVIYWENIIINCIEILCVFYDV